MTIQPHDFSRPPSLHPETRAKLVQWLTRANAQLAEVIAGYALQVEIRFDDCFTAWPTDEMLQWSEKALGFRVKLPDTSSLSLVALPNPLAQILVGTLLGDQAEEWPEEREMTPSEQSVGEFVVSTIMANLIDTWSGDTAVDLKVVDRESNLRRTKMFKPKEPFIVCRSTMTTPLGSGQWCWMLPHEFLSKLFGAVRGTSMASEAATRQQLESLARDMTTQVTIRLGGVQLSAPQLAELRVGDLVVLNQKTTEPLRAIVSGKPRFLGWPGRVGNRQAFEISSEGTRRDRSTEIGNDIGVGSSRLMEMQK